MTVRGSGPGSSGRVKVAIVGCPNVGKSVLFGQLTGRYVSVSNYPGTTVEVARGIGRWGGRTFEVADTPGLYSLTCITDEERAARRLLMRERPDWLLHVVDAKNLGRMLPLTFQLVEAGFRVAVIVNMLDEARAAGLDVDVGCLAGRLGVPAIGAALTRGEGLAEIKAFLAGEEAEAGRIPVAPLLPVYDEVTERALAAVTSRLRGDYAMDGRAIALLALQEDPEMLELVRREESEGWLLIRPVLEEANRGPRPVRHRPPLATHRLARSVAEACVRQVASPRRSTGQVLGDLLLRPLFGLPVLAAVVYFGLYRFVGGFGAGVLVDTLDRTLFLSLVNPWLDRTVDTIFASPVWRELFAHEYGLLTLGVRYAVAIVLPIVGTFFLAFAILEDSGYLPRLALLADRVFKPLGLSGRVLIPLTLGLGCGTMATLVTRTLETRRERVLATFLLALGVPCSAQLGVVMGILSGRPHALAVWSLAVVGALVTGGTIASRLLPGRAAPFFIEVPPLRLPSLGNIWRKTTARMTWYFREILPVFLAASVVIWLGRLTGLFPLALQGLAGVCRWLGLPREVSVVFLFGFLRRDYGAAGLYDLAPNLPTSALVVAAVTLTLFVPCLAQTVLMFKERGPKVALTIVGVVFPLAILGGYVLSRLLNLVGGAGW
jgi:ferrous iron transport protein B